jgi:hypothetical protein
MIGASGVVASEIHIQIVYIHMLVQHWLCRSGDYDKISLIHLEFPLGISKPLEKQRGAEESDPRGPDDDWLDGPAMAQLGA